MCTVVIHVATCIHLCLNNLPICYCTDCSTGSSTFCKVIHSIKTCYTLTIYQINKTDRTNENEFYSRFIQITYTNDTHTHIQTHTHAHTHTHTHTHTHSRIHTFIHTHTHTHTKLSYIMCSFLITFLSYFNVKQVIVYHLDGNDLFCPQLDIIGLKTLTMCKSPPWRCYVPLCITTSIIRLR